MENLIIGGIIVIILGLCIGYIVKAKKRGVRCIGCPSSGKCSGHCTNGDSYSSDNKNIYDDICDLNIKK